MMEDAIYWNLQDKEGKKLYLRMEPAVNVKYYHSEYNFA